MEMDAAAEVIEGTLGYRFSDRGLLVLALTHRTWIEERHPGGGAPGHLSQQRLEFLGDGLLNYVVARWLYERFPRADEGELTGRRKQFTQGEWLRERGESLGLGSCVLLGRGEEANAAHNRKLLEDTVEAIIGAVALDGGDERATALVLGWLPQVLPTWDPREASDPVVRFGEWFQARYRKQPPEPRYEGSGPPHRRSWTAEILVDGLRGLGEGQSKPEAKRAACRNLLNQIAVREQSAKLDQVESGG